MIQHYVPQATKSTYGRIVPTYLPTYLKKPR
jgi:hypothetical protein